MRSWQVLGKDRNLCRIGGGGDFLNLLICVHMCIVSIPICFSGHN